MLTAEKIIRMKKLYVSRQHIAQKLTHQHCALISSLTTDSTLEQCYLSHQFAIIPPYPSPQRLHKNLCVFREIIYSRRTSAWKGKQKTKVRLPVQIVNLVLLSTKSIYLEDGLGTEKLHPQLSGPFPILQFITDVTVKLGSPTPVRAKRIHSSFLVIIVRYCVQDSLT